MQPYYPAACFPLFNLSGPPNPALFSHHVFSEVSWSGEPQTRNDLGTMVLSQVLDASVAAARSLRPGLRGLPLQLGWRPGVRGALYGPAPALHFVSLKRRRLHGAPALPVAGSCCRLSGPDMVACSHCWAATSLFFRFGGLGACAAAAIIQGGTAQIGTATGGSGTGLACSSAGVPALPPGLPLGPALGAGATARGGATQGTSTCLFASLALQSSDYSRGSDPAPHWLPRSARWRSPPPRTSTHVPQLPISWGCRPRSPRTDALQCAQRSISGGWQRPICSSRRRRAARSDEHVLLLEGFTPGRRSSPNAAPARH